MNFIQQAYKGRTEWYWYLITLFIISIFWQFIGVIPLSVAAFLKVGSMDKFMEAAKDAFATVGLNSNLYLFLVLLTLIMGLVGLLIGIKFIHNRLIKTVVTSRNKIDWKRVFYAFGLWFSIFVVIITIGIFLDSENLIWNFKPIPFLILVLISLLFIPLQTSFEELLFRGYLMQGLGVLAKNRWIPLLVTSLIFGLLHGANPEVQKLGLGIMVFYIGTGLLFGITTLMDEGTELALGLHAANNIVAAIFVTTDWTVFQTEALYIDTSEPSLGWETYLPVFVLYPIILFIFSKKYGWKNWTEKLFGKIENPTLITEE
ncbi:MAG: CPBP family intramembrane metalloprotease [Flavobacteriaceae bacterium]|nr:CPBP family intramembrane metalloprotease [Flavobacteriaceae bacterium]